MVGARGSQQSLSGTAQLDEAWLEEAALFAWCNYRMALYEENAVCMYVWKQLSTSGKDFLVPDN